MIIGALLLRNEADIIHECLTHHLNQGVDAFIITNNLSVDATRSIVGEFKEVVEIIDEPDGSYRHGTWMTRMARKAFALNADWVIPIDGDEFWYGVDELRSQPADVGVTWIRNFFNHPPTPEASLEFARSQMPFCYRLDRFLEVENKCGRMAFRPTKTIIVSDGNHGVENEIGRHVSSDKMFIHHYPARSFEQFERKITLGVESLRKNDEKSLGIHWKNWYNSGNLRGVYDELLKTAAKEILTL